MPTKSEKTKWYKTVAIVTGLLGVVILTNGLLVAGFDLGTELVLTTFGLVYLLRYRLGMVHILRQIPTMLFAFSLLCVTLNLDSDEPWRVMDYYYLFFGAMLATCLLLIDNPRIVIGVFALLFICRFAILYNALVNSEHDQNLAQQLKANISTDSVYLISTPSCGNCIVAINHYLDYAEANPTTAKPMVGIMLVQQGSSPQQIAKITHGEPYRVLHVSNAVFNQAITPVLIYKDHQARITTFYTYLKGWDPLYHRFMARYIDWMDGTDRPKETS